MNYKGLVFDEPRPPATTQELAMLESALGCSLPPDYAAFLTATNGAVLNYEVTIHFEDGSKEDLSFASLYRVSGEGSWETNPFELTQQRAAAGFPGSGVLPIGRDGGSSVLYLDLREGYEVVAFVHGLPSWTGLRQQDSLVNVASSFDEYLEKLHISDDSAEAHISTFEVSPDTVRATIEWLDSGNQGWRVKFKELWNSRISFAQIENE